MALKAEALRLPTVPNDWAGQDSFNPLGKLSATTQRNIEPVGAHFLAEARRKRHKRTFSEDERIQAQEAVKKTEDNEDDDISDTEDPLMLSRDAKDWKSQDHYAVLGLSKYRYRATPDQVKRAHRKKVLKHHPDKRAASGSTEDDSFFKCIQKATEVLLDPVKRRQFDSVDTEADVDIPSKQETKDAVKSKGEPEFFKLWAPIFESEARFSKVDPVPQLGDDSSTKEEVEAFYNFWYNFDSWRSFEYQDEDVPDDNEHRDQKRQIEKKNQASRRKKKTQDTARLRFHVDEALSLDHRIARFRREEKAQKNKKRNEREAEAKRLAEEAALKKAEEEQAAKEAADAEQREKAEGKKAKEAAKNAAKKNKRVVRAAAKDANYFLPAAEAASPQRIDAVLNDVDLLLGKIDPDALAVLAGKLGGKPDFEAAHAALADEVSRMTLGGALKEGEASTLRAS